MAEVSITSKHLKTYYDNALGAIEDLEDIIDEKDDLISQLQDEIEELKNKET